MKSLFYILLPMIFLFNCKAQTIQMYVGTYTQVEAEMYKAACKALGIKGTEMIKGPSAEPPDTNTQSTVQPFKGYPR